MKMPGKAGHCRDREYQDNMNARAGSNGPESISCHPGRSLLWKRWNTPRLASCLGHCRNLPVTFYYSSITISGLDEMPTSKVPFLQI